MRKRAKRKAFTLLELLIVMVIIGILAVVAIPQYLDAVNTANETSSIQQLKEIREMVVYMTSLGMATPDPTQDMCLDTNGDGACEKSLRGVTGAACTATDCTLGGFTISLDDGTIS